MKFELTEIVAVPNPDEVLRVLEQHLRIVAGEVVRSRSQVTAYGIGPSPRTVNRRDTTVIEGHAVEGTTVLQVIVTYQASALLGNMPQDDIVRSKIEGAIDETRGELRVWKAGVPPPGLDTVVTETTVAAAEGELPQTLQQPRAFDPRRERWPAPPKEEAIASVPEESVPLVDAAAVDVRLAAPEAAPPELKEVPPEASPDIVTDAAAQAEVKNDAADPEVTPAQIADTSLRPEQPVIRLSATSRKRARRLATTHQPMAEQSVANPAGSENVEAETAEEWREINGRIKTSAATAVREVPLRGLLRGQDSERTLEFESPPRGRWKSVLVIVLILLMASGGAAYAFREVLPIPEPWKVLAADWSAKLEVEFSNLKAIMAEKAAGSTVSVVAVPVAPPADDSSAATGVSDPEVMVKPESNIYLWVQDWAAALRSKDPVAQASYYADTVDRYLNETAVSHDAVLKAKKDAIAQRSELWSVKVEHVYVESQSATGMSVRVVKRMLSRNGSGSMSQERMKVRLKVVRANGTWKIVEEQELGPPASSVP